MDLTAARAALAKSRSPRVNRPAGGLSIVSDLGPDEPVTAAEIQLVLAFLGDKITEILDPTSAPCPPSTKARVG